MLADNDKINRKGSVLALRCCALPLKLQEDGQMDKKEALRKLIASADAYKECLEGKNLMIVYADASGECTFFETVFSRRQFAHLTGVDTSLSSSQLYSRLLDRRLSVNDFELRTDGTTELKLGVLSRLFRFASCARMVGELHSGSVMHLRTEKLAGGTFACMGFVPDGRYYVPNKLSVKTSGKLQNTHSTEY